MTTRTIRRPHVALGAAVGLCVVAGCNLKDSLLEPQNPGLIDPTAVTSPSAANALRVGALGRLKNLVNGSGGEALWTEAGHLADEYKNSDFQNTRQDIDQRAITTNNGIIPYSATTQIRGAVRDAIRAMKSYNPTQTADIGELYMALGFVEMSLAENFCNGIPLGNTVNGEVTLGAPLTNAQVLDTALVHLDSAIALANGTDAGSVFVRSAASITKARILVDKGQYAAAAAVVPAATVASTYQYIWTTSTALTTDDLGIWSLNNSLARVTVSDSFDIVNGANNIIGNALPFASANDPRVPVKPGSLATPKVVSEDGATPLFVQQIWTGRDDPIPMVSGVDARLIEAEARLNTQDIAGMTTILNALRTAPPRIGNFQPTVMTALAAPSSQAAARALLFREKAFWTFGRGQRLNDLRRLVRQYGLPQDQVFPTGVYYKGGVYGSDVNFPVPDAELINPAFKGCIDRKA